MLDVTKCIGCRKGIGIFTKEPHGYNHVDVFNTIESGAIFRCKNSSVIGQYLIKNENTGTYLPNKEFKEFLLNQGSWWGDILDILYEIFQSSEDDINEFFNTEIKGKKLWNLPNQRIEEKVLQLADKNNLEIRMIIYPDLYKSKRINRDEI
jgi:hypothetical protein